MEHDAVVVSFGLNDAVKLSPAEFRADYEVLIADIGRAFPHCRLLLATSTPLDDRHALAAEERFKDAGGLDAWLEKNYVAAVRELAAEKGLPLVDQYKTIKDAIAGGEPLESLVRPDGVHLTARGNLLAGRATADAVLVALGIVERMPERAEVASPPQEEPEPDLTPLLGLWDKHLAAAAAKTLRDPDAATRTETVVRLTEAAVFSEELLSLLVELLDDPDTNVSSQASNWLLRVAGERAVPALLTRFRGETMEPYVRTRVLPLLVQFAGGRSSSVRRTPPSRPAGEDGESISFTRSDCALLAGMLDFTDPYVRQHAGGLLLYAGSSGAAAIIEKIEGSSEAEAAELVNLFWRRGVRWGQAQEIEALRRFMVKQARNADRPFLARTCLELVRLTRFRLPQRT